MYVQRKHDFINSRFYAWINWGNVNRFCKEKIFLIKNVREWYIKHSVILHCCSQYLHRLWISILYFPLKHRYNPKKFRKQGNLFLNSSFRREVNQNRAVQDYYEARSGNSSPTFRDNFRSHIQQSRIRFFNFEDVTDRFSRNVSKELLLLSAEHPRTAQFSEKSL